MLRRIHLAQIDNSRPTQAPWVYIRAAIARGAQHQDEQRRQRDHPHDRRGGPPGERAESKKPRGAGRPAHGVAWAVAAPGGKRAATSFRHRRGPIWLQGARGTPYRMRAHCDASRRASRWPPKERRGQHRLRSGSAGATAPPALFPERGR